ncbi:type II secretion system F family protein [Streptomyces sp. RFCAC02]|uniref:type II secretion system F family protein n=1 Tax=Streptomyces sp. RFCAC02 TaxID=2499143 RepID=UPI001F0F7A2C|nr:type II secretion system F family protein [Streptomyces sp. RFCAC02]
MTGHAAQAAATVVAAAVLTVSVSALAGTAVRALRGHRLRVRVGALDGERRPPLLRGVVDRLRRDRERPDPALPLATGLLAACLAAGAAPGTAAGAVGAALDGPLDGPVGDRLRTACAELRLGGDPAAVWRRFSRLRGAAGLARRLETADTGGVPVAETVTAEAAAGRERRGRAAQAAARRAAVLVTGPLGLCFLPAFLLIGVVPVVIGLTKELL